MSHRLFSFLSLFMVLAVLSAFAPIHIRPFAVQAQSDFPATPVVSQEGPAGVEASVAQALASAPETAAATIVQSAQNVEFVGQVGGETDAVATQGSYAYIGVGQRLTILNISNPASPTTVGKTTQLGGIVLSVAVAGSYAYVAAGLRLHVVDVSNPSNPYEVGFYDTPGRAVTVAGSYAYVAATSQGLRVVDISTPANPYEVGSYDTPGSAYDVVVAGSYAYVADMSSGLRVVNVATPSAPYEVSFCDTPGGAGSVAVAGSYAYVADGDQGLRVVNISNPSNPWEVGHWVTSWPNQMAWDVAVSGSYAYVAYSGAGLRVVNISVPSNPWEVGSYSPNISSGFALAVAISGSYAYIAYEYRGLQVANISAPSNPIGIGRYELLGWTNGVAFVGNYAYVANGYQGLQIVNISVPSNPTLVGSCDLYGYAWDLVIAGSYAYIADGFAGGFQVVNIANPSNPYAVGSYCMSDDGATDVALAGSYAYVAFGTRGLRVLNISSPSYPYEVGFYDTPGSAYSVTIVGGYAYVADDTGGLRVVDISVPSNPREVGFYDTPGNARAVAVAGSYAYVADGSTGLQIVNVSTPTNPSGVGVYDTPGDARGVAVAGSIAYAADAWTGGLRVLDVSSPSHPKEMGFYDTPNDAWGVSTSGNLVYVGDGRGGLYILRITTAYAPGIYGYQFENRRTDAADWDTFRDTYGAENVDSNPFAWEYYLKEYLCAFPYSIFGCTAIGRGALCSGMTASSGLFYKEWIDPVDLLESQGVEYPIQLDTPTLGAGGFWEADPVVDLLVRYQGYQNGKEISNFQREYNLNLTETLAAITDSIDAGLADPVTIGIWNPYGDKCPGHALLPYRYEVDGVSTSVYVYDPNQPKDPNRFVLFDTQANTWSYQSVLGTWTSTEWQNSQLCNGFTGLKAVPLWLWKQRPTPPWLTLGLQGSDLQGDEFYYELSVGDLATLLIEDDAGNRIGYQGAVFYDEIAGAVQVHPIGVIPGVAPDYPERYQLPIGLDFGVHLHHESAGGVGLLVVAPGKLVRASGNAATSGTEDLVEIDDNWLGFSLSVGSDTTDCSLDVTSGDAEFAYTHGIHRSFLASGSQAQFFAPADNQLGYRVLGSSSSYAVSLKLAGAITGSFWATGISIEENDTHHVTIDWDAPETALLEIDQDSDGDIDDTIVLENEVNQVYLPLVFRNF